MVVQRAHYSIVHGASYGEGEPNHSGAHGGGNAADASFVGMIGYQALWWTE